MKPESSSYVPVQASDNKTKTTDSQKKDKKTKPKEFEPETKPQAHSVAMKPVPEFYMARQYTQMQQNRYTGLIAKDQSPPKYRAAVIPARPPHKQIQEPKKF